MTMAQDRERLESTAAGSSRGMKNLTWTPEGGETRYGQGWELCGGGGNGGGDAGRRQAGTGRGRAGWSARGGSGSMHSER